MVMRYRDRFDQAAVINNNRCLYRLNTIGGSQKPDVSKVSKKSDGSLIHFQTRQQERCTNHLRD